MSLLQRIKQRFCAHRVAWTDVRRVAAERVECPCLRCGRVLSASYGAALDAAWQQPSPAQLERLYARSTDGVAPSRPFGSEPQDYLDPLHRGTKPFPHCNALPGYVHGSACPDGVQGRKS